MSVPQFSENLKKLPGVSHVAAIRLLDASGEIVASQDAVPVHWAYPTTAWRPGETVIDAYDFVLPADIDPSTLTPLVILYRSANGEEVGRFSLQ